MRLSHPLRPVSLRPVKHVGCKICEEEEEGRAKKSLKSSETAAKHPVKGTKHRVAASPATKRASEKFHEEEAGDEENCKGDDRSRCWRRMETGFDAFPKLSVEELQHGNGNHPRKKGNHFVHEASHEPYGSASDQKQKDEQVECGHAPALAEGNSR